MVPVDHLGVDDGLLGFSAWVYLNNAQQETCVYADAITGCIRRFVVYQVCRPIYDPFGHVADAIISSCVLEDADDNTIYETVFGEVKIYVSKKLLMEYRDKIPDILPYRLYAISDKLRLNGTWFSTGRN